MVRKNSYEGSPPIHYDFDRAIIQSSAFDNSPGTNAMSVNLARLSSVEETLAGHPGYGIASLTAESLYVENQHIRHKPESNNFAHCDVEGDKPKRVRRRLRDSAKLLITPESTR